MPDTLAIFRNVDLLLIAVALPVFLVAGWPLAGWAAGGGAYVAQRAIAQYAKRKAEETDDIRKMAGIMTGSMIGRGWLVALTILIVGLSVSDASGLAAGVLFLAVFTVAFTAQIVLRPFDTPHQPTT